MFTKMGFKKWSRGSQMGIRIYSSSINSLSEVLNYPSLNGYWSSLCSFLCAIEKSKGNLSIKPYSRKIEIISNNFLRKIPATMTIAQHDHSTQGYITIPSGNWLSIIVAKNLNKNYFLEYISTVKKDILILPNFSIDLVKQRENELKDIENRALKNKKIIPRNLDKIGLYFELKEVKYIKNKSKLVPNHRFPYLESKVPEIKKKNISCDIDVFSKQRKFVKFVEVKAVYGVPPNEFNLTINEYNSRLRCKKSKLNYEIVAYYHIGKSIIKRQVISKNDKLSHRPSGYFCYV